MTETNFSAMSNDELLREYQKQSTYSGMSNEELKAVYARQAGKPQEDRTWYEDLAKKSLASIEKGIVAVPEKAGTFLGKVSAPFLPLSQNLDAEIAKSVPSYVPPSEADNILKSNIAPAVRQYYEKQGAYKPENQFTSWPGQLLGSALEFIPEMLTTFPMTGAGKVSSLVEKGLEKAGTRLMPNVNNAALGLLGRTAARGAGGAAGAVPYTLATEDKPSSAMLDNMLGFGAASAGFGLAGDLVKGLTKGIASRIRTKAPITEDMLNETFVKPEQKQITFENKNRPGETFTMPENLPEGFVKGMSPEEMAAIQRTKGTDIEKLLAKLPESLDYNKMSDAELKNEYVRQKTEVKPEAPIQPEIPKVEQPKGKLGVPTPARKAVAEGKTLEEFVGNEYDKWLAEINTNVNNLDYNVNEVYALRGDNFIPKKTFRKSFNSPDTKKTTRMDGISGVELAINAAGGDNSISMNHLLKQIEKAGKYGKNIFLLKGEKIGLGNDEWNNEIMLGKHKIIGKITKSDITKAFEEAKKQGNLDVLYTLGGKNPYNDLPRDSKARVKTVFDYITAKGITATDDQIKKLLDPRETAVFKSLTASPSPESFGSRQRSFLETAAKSPIITEPLQKKVKDISPQDYIVQPMPSQFVKADLRIADGIDRAIEYVKDTKTVTTEIPEKSATFQRIIDYFQNNGRMDRAAEFIDLYDQSLREWGRGIQLASRHSMAAIDKASPEAFVKWAEKQITTAKAERGWLDKKLGKEIPDLTNEDKAALLQMINDANKIPDYIERNVEKLKAVELVAKRIPPGISSMIDSYRYQNMLSGWITTERNTGSNIINTYLTRPYDLAIRGGIDWGKSIVTGKERQHYLTDVPDYYKGAFNSFGNAVEAFRLAMSGKTPIGKPELGVEAKTAIEQARAAQMPKALTVIPRFMEAQDKFFMTIIVDAEYALNIKKGMGQDIAYTKAVDTAQELLYRTSLKSQHAGLSMPSQALKGLGVLLLKGRNTPGLRTISKWGVPFVTTPVNVGIQMIERSPLAILRTNIGEAAVTKMTGGIIVSAAGAMAAMNGNTTWSAPTNEDEKKWFYATGRKPYSVRIGDNWVSMWYAGPFALALALPAAYKHYTADAKESVSWGTLEKTGRMAVGVGRLIGSQTSAQSVGNLFSWMAGDDVKAPGQIAFTASQLIPLSGTMRNISTLVDPVYRKPTTFAENMKQGIPFMSRSLAANRTPEGTEAVRETKNALIPYNISSSTEYEKMYPAYKEMRQMEYIGRKIDSIGKKLMAGEITQETADSQLDILMKNVLKPTNEGGLR